MGNLCFNIVLFAQAVNETKEEVAETSLLSPWMLFFLVVLMIGLPFLLGNLIARQLKVKDLATKIAVILLATELALGPFVAEYISGWAQDRDHQKQLDKYNDKQKKRNTISQADLKDLEDAVTGIDIRGKDQLKSAPPPERVDKPDKTDKTKKTDQTIKAKKTKKTEKKE